jgi:hypothetical protein
LLIVAPSSQELEPPTIPARFNLGNAGRYYIDFSTLSIWFENEADAIAYRNRLAMIGT